MAYKNSGAMKFNDATDLVIRADPDGTVESVFNKADNTEYIGLYTNIESVTVSMTNSRAVAVSGYFPMISNEYIRANAFSVAAGGTESFNLLKNGLLRITTTNTNLNVISGDVEPVSGGIYTLIKGPCALELVDA